MKSKIRLKIKHLILLPILIFIVFPNALYLVARGIYMNYEYKPYSYGLFKLYDNFPKISCFEGDAKFYMGKLRYDYMGYFHFGSGDTGIYYQNYDLGTYEEALEFHKEGLENSDGVDYSLNLTAILNLYLERGEMDKAKELVENSKKEEAWEKNLGGKVGNIQILIIEGKTEEALKAYEKLKEEYGPNDLLKSRIEGKSIYGEQAIIGDRFSGYNKEKLLRSLINGMKLYTCDERPVDEEKSTLKNKDISIKGRITVEGQPLKYQAVLIGASGNEGTMLYSNINQAYGKIVYTNENGEYYANGIEADDSIGVYVIGSKEIGEKYTIEEMYIKNVKSKGQYIINGNLNERMNVRIKEETIEGDKLNIEFDEVKGAEKYIIRICTNSKGYIAEEYKGVGIAETFESKDNKFTLELFEGSLIGMKGRNYAQKVGEEIIDTTNYIGNTNGANIISIYVEAIKKDKDNEKRILNSRRILLNKKSKVKDLNEGEKLMVKGKITEGTEWFIEQIKNNGYKREWIYPLLYTTSQFSYDEKNINKEELDKRINKAKEAEKILLDELYKINKNDDEIEYFKSLYSELYSYFRYK